MTTRNLAIDLIKGASVLYIVGFWHLLNYTNAFPGYDNELTRRATVFVLGLFVFVSGYLVGHRHSRSGPDNLLAYYRSRLTRIYPPYLIAIACFFISGISDSNTLMKAAGLISMFVGPPPPTLWFITMIVFFYVLAPVLIYYLDNALSFFAVCAFVEFGFISIDLSGLAIDNRIAIYFPTFVIGLFLSKRAEFLIASNTGRIAVAFLGSAAMSVAHPNFPERSCLSIPFAMTGATVSYVLLKRWESHLTRWNFIAPLSYAGYFMFLFHRPLYQAFTKSYFPSTPPMQAAYLFFFCLPSVFAISWAMQRIYDRLIRTWDRRYSGERR